MKIKKNKIANKKVQKQAKLPSFFKQKSVNLEQYKKMNKKRQKQSLTNEMADKW